jgi:hypothetical protein
MSSGSTVIQVVLAHRDKIPSSALSHTFTSISTLIPDNRSNLVLDPRITKAASRRCRYPSARLCHPMRRRRAGLACSTCEIHASRPRRPSTMKRVVSSSSFPSYAIKRAETYRTKMGRALLQRTVGFRFRVLLLFSVSIYTFAEKSRRSTFIMQRLNPDHLWLNYPWPARSRFYYPPALDFSSWPSCTTGMSFFCEYFHYTCHHRWIN